MESENSKNLSDFILETDPYFEQLNDLPLGTAAELYDLLDDAANAATLNIDSIDPELRVELCIRKDMVLDRIVDELPPFESTGHQMKIFAPSMAQYRDWQNVDLMKDCGLAPFMLSKVIGAKPVMLFGTEGVDYPYLSDLPGLELLYRKETDDRIETYFNHLEENYAEMDVLLLYGLRRQSTTDYLEAYRLLRPDGKVYIGIDMNTYWMRHVDWDTPQLNLFSQQCDVIATSCRLMRDTLNRSPQVRFACNWLANGFYNPTDIKIVADPDYKENTILTVARIGTPEKNNEELVISFAGLADALPGWKLKLVGPIDPRIDPFIDWFFTTYPNMKDRVIFTGPITDKKELYDEYAKAKIFVLTSRSESGTPNVYAEALVHGCMFISSGIDGADDITNYGELGLKYERGETGSLAHALMTLCSKADADGFREHIPKALEYAARYYSWERNAKKLAYMLFK